MMKKLFISMSIIIALAMFLSITNCEKSITVKEANSTLIIDPAEGKELHTFNLKNVTFLPGRFSDQFDNMKQYYLNIPNDDLLYGFRKRAGLPHPGEELPGWYSFPDNPNWDDWANMFGQWLSTYARIYSVTGEQVFLEKLKYLVSEWGKTIEHDGYYFYSNNCRAYNYDYDKIVGGLVDAYRFAGISEALIYLDRVTGWAEKHLERTRKPARSDNFVGENNDTQGTDGEWYTLSENLYRAYLYSGNERYRDFASVWHYTTYWDGMRTGDPDVLTGMHAYSHVNTLSSAAMAYIVTGEKRYLKTIISAYNLLKQYQMMASGGYGPNEILQPPDGSLGESLDYKDRGSFEVPCGSWAGFKLAKYLITVTGDASYGDWIESLVYNAIGATLMITDKIQKARTFYYADYRIGGGKKVYYGGYTCCSGTFPLAISEYNNLIYFHNDSTICVNLFIPSEVEKNINGNEVKIVQETKFPEEETISLKISCKNDTEFILKFRIPEWTKRENISSILSGEKIQPILGTDNWASIKHTWQDGDEIIIKLPTRLRFLPIDKQHPNRAALMYGPVMLAIKGKEVRYLWSDVTNPPDEGGGPLYGDINNPGDWIKPAGDAPLHFIVKGEKNNNQLFMPYYEFGRKELYFVYNDVLD